MAPRSHTPDDRRPLNELGDPLRQLVEQVRQRPPAEAEARALERARRLTPPAAPLRLPRPWLSRYGPILATAGVAALVLFGVGERLSRLPRVSVRVAPAEAGGAELALGRQAPVHVLSVPAGLQKVSLLSTPRDGTQRDWARLSRVRGMARDLSSTDRHGLERYLRTLGSGSGGDPLPVAWRREPARPRHARVVTDPADAVRLTALHVTVRVEGPRARTVVDHVFHNGHAQALEGTFEYPLPPGASLHYLACMPGKTAGLVPPLFPPTAPPGFEATRRALPPAERTRRADPAAWGAPVEGRVLPRGSTPVDPPEEAPAPAASGGASGGSAAYSFRVRVPPLAPEGYSRVVLAYDELLPVIRDSLEYTFPLPGGRLDQFTVTLETPAEEARACSLAPPGATREERDGLAQLRHTWADAAPTGELVYRSRPDDARVQSASGRSGDSGPCYFVARVQPELPAVDRPGPAARHGVFFLDTSFSETPDRFQVSMKLLSRILQDDADLTHFNVLAFDVTGRWLEPAGWIANTPAGRATVLDRLDGLLLEGATDFSAAVERLTAAPFITSETPLDCFLLSDGHLNWGETSPAALEVRLRQGFKAPARVWCYRTGLGEENGELFEALTRRGGGVFNCFSEAGVAAVARAHRQQVFQIESVRFERGPTVREVLVAGGKACLTPGDELILAGQADGPGKVRLVLEGRFGPRRLTRTHEIVVGETGQLAQRAWGELAVSSLQALRDPRLEDLATAYGQRYSVLGRTTALALVDPEVETTAVDLAAERERIQPGDLGEFLAHRRPPREHPSGRLALLSLLQRMDSRTRVLTGPAAQPLRELLGRLGDADFRLLDAPAARSGDGLALVKGADVENAYLVAREDGRSRVPLYLDEARRRGAARDPGGALRVLSCVVEEHPGSTDAQRLAGYRLLDLGQPAQAVRLFRQAQAERPFDPHAHRDLARGFESTGRPVLAALCYEVILAGEWAAESGAVVKPAAREEYAHLVRGQLASSLRPDLRTFYDRRLDSLAAIRTHKDLRVSVTWNTEAADVELLVLGPDGERLGPAGPQDGERPHGCGPELFSLNRARPGEYRIVLRHLRPGMPRLGGETHAEVIVERAGERPRRHGVILRRAEERVEVCREAF